MKKFFLLSFCISFLSCEPEISPINYGNDACFFCMMTIVDNQHAAELVTVKGKPIKYDAIECMIRDYKDRDQSKFALILITDFSSPGKLIEGKSAVYLISKNLPSPMGANLTGFSSESEAKIIQDEKGGKLYSWKEIVELF